MTASVPHERRALEEIAVPTVALATCAMFPTLDDDDRLVLPELARLGIDVVPAVWDEPDVDWASFDAVVIRETWDYPERRDEFVEWLRRVAATTLLLNPADIVEWNTDKRYLRELDALGVPIVPTVFIEPSDDGEWQPDSGYGEFVVKPAVSAGSRDTARYEVDGDLTVAREHVRRLQRDGRTVMVQPYLEAIDTAGETAMLFIGGTFSHAIRKAPILVRGVEGQLVDGLFAKERIDPRAPTERQLAVAHAATAAIPGGVEAVLYARVDLIDDSDGSPRLLELELAEPSLFLEHSEAAPARLASAIAERLSRA